MECSDSIYRYDATQQEEFLAAKPWAADPQYFKKIKISPTVLLKMMMHARSGGKLEIMGMLFGKIDHGVIIVMDSFALPVEGTETRVNAHTEAYEYMSVFLDSSRKVNRLENIIGWYHSHPGYGCWLSGIDVSTQMINQKYQDPFVAIVVDPVQTVATNRVHMGAFRTYPEDFIATGSKNLEFESVPLDKIEDFGVHSEKYYSLDVSYFHSELDSKLIAAMYNESATNILSSSSLMDPDYMTDRMLDFVKKLEKSEEEIIDNHYAVIYDHARVKPDTKLEKAVKECCKITSEVIRSIMLQLNKEKLFGQMKNK